MNLISNIEIVSSRLIDLYNLDPIVFLWIYILSFIPFYLGYFLIIYGSTRTLRWQDVIRFRLRNKLQWNDGVKLGLIVHLFGRIMPYAYIVIYGKNLPLWAYIITVSVISISLAYGLRKLFYSELSAVSDNVEVFRSDNVDDVGDAESLWKVYDDTFKILNTLSPCRQSFDRDHFMEVLKDTTVRKYILKKPDVGIIGVALSTNDFKNTPWISWEYFESNYPEYFKNKKIFYFMGIAVHDDHRGNKYSIRLIEQVIDDLPEGSIMGFDHSRNINPMLHHFTRLIKHAPKIKRDHIDRQHYHVVQWK